VPWLRRLAAGTPPRRPGFDPGSVHVGFVVDKVALGQVFPRVLRFSPVTFIPPLLHYWEKDKKKWVDQQVTRFPAGARYFSRLQRVLTGAGANPAAFSMAAGGLLPQRQGGRGIKLTTIVHLMPKLRINKAIPPFTTWFHGVHRDRFYQPTLINPLESKKDFHNVEI
jgi:hypothetical protein